MLTLSIHVFRDCSSPFISMLKEHRIDFTSEALPGDKRKACADVIKIRKQENKSWSHLAAVVGSWVSSSPTRKVIITTTEYDVSHIQIFSEKEAEYLLGMVRTLSVIDTDSH